MKTTKKEKREFIEGITKTVKESLLEKLDDIPENWDGYELRQWFSDYVKEEIAYMEMSKERKENYKNDRIINNL